MLLVYPILKVLSSHVLHQHVLRQIWALLFDVALVFLPLLLFEIYECLDDELLWILLEEDRCNMAEFVDVPKILSDLFESVIGAIYLDSGKNLNIVWEILYSLINVPKQPVRMIYETPGAHPRFLNSEIVDGTNIIMVPLEVQISNEKKLFHGFGSSKRQAKAAAAKFALKAFKHNR
ncbi:hypothetical protein PV325_011740 [Microctonus aethiopoides]|nr:hypothetical protein PV325_011740 [Microctonus aethiopoides]